MKPVRTIQTISIILSILKAFSLFAGVQAQAPEAERFTLYLPASLKAGDAVTPPPASGALPAELVTTWYTGNLPLNDFYDPTTGEWRAQNGLGETYTFKANGDFVYAGFLRLQNGQCLSEVSSYRQGKAQAAAGQLTLTPTIAKTRTVIRCGSNSESSTDGPFEPTTLAYQVADEANGHINLVLGAGEKSTSFYREGMVQSLAGKWHYGEVTSAGFYNPATKSFAEQSGAGGWFEFKADGSYRFGEFGYGTNNQGCALTAWIYQEGTITVQGGRLTTTPTAGALRVDNACKPAAPVVQDYTEDVRSFTWLLRDRTTDLKLVIIPLERFEEVVYVRE